MKKRLIPVLAVICVVVGLFSVLETFSLSEMFLFQRDITFSTIQNSDNSSTQFVYFADADDSKTTVANLHLRVEPEYNNQRRVYVDIKHEANTELDSVTLKFQSSQVISVYYAGYPSTSYTFSRNDGPNTNTATITYDSALGSLQGSTPLQFILGTTGTENSDFNLYMQVEARMHYMQPLELTQIKAETQQNINLHQNT